MKNVFKKEAPEDFEFKSIRKFRCLLLFPQMVDVWKKSPFVTEPRIQNN